MIRLKVQLACEDIGTELPIASTFAAGASVKTALTRREHVVQPSCARTVHILTGLLTRLVSNRAYS